MHQYTLIDPVTGQQTFLSEAELTRSLRPNCILLRGKEYLGIITHRDLVLFAQWCAMEAIARVKDAPTPEVQYALTLVDRWLEDQQSVTPEELEAAAGAAWAAWAAWAAAGAAEAAGFAWAAAGAAEAAGFAWAARAAAGAASYEAQAQWWVEHLQSGQ